MVMTMRYQKDQGGIPLSLTIIEIGQHRWIRKLFLDREVVTLSHQINTNFKKK